MIVQELVRLRVCAEVRTLLDDGWRLIGSYALKGSKEHKDFFVFRHGNKKRLSISLFDSSYEVKVNGKLKKRVYV